MGVMLIKSKKVKKFELIDQCMAGVVKTTWQGTATIDYFNKVQPAY
jgi:hypothetical protein